MRSLLGSAVSPHLVQIIVDPGLFLFVQNSSRCFQELIEFNEGLSAKSKGSSSKLVFLSSLLQNIENAEVLDVLCSFDSQTCSKVEALLHKCPLC